MVKKLLIFTGFVFFAISCSQEKKVTDKTSVQTQKVEEKKEEWKPEMYEPSPLAKMMKEMFKINSERREMILNNINFGDTLNNLRGLHSAKPTEASDDTPLFHALAEAHIISDSILAITDFQQKKEVFNNHINNCISCHQNFCMGPVGKIKTLITKE
jgi:hypothetical protein